MANERRLIDIAPYENMSCATSCQIYVYRTIGRNCEISMYGTDGIPTVDAVEVCFCKDCRHYTTGKFAGLGGKCICAKFFGMITPKPDDFCSRGEKREVE